MCRRDPLAGQDKRQSIVHFSLPGSFWKKSSRELALPLSEVRRRIEKNAFGPAIDYTVFKSYHSDSSKRVGTRFSSETRESQVTNVARSTIATAKILPICAKKVFQWNDRKHQDSFFGVHELYFGLFLKTILLSDTRRDRNRVASAPPHSC